MEHQTEKLAAHHGRREKEARDAVEKLRAAQDAAREIAEVLAEAEEMLGREQVTRDRARQALEDAEEELKRLQVGTLTLNSIKKPRPGLARPWRARRRSSRGCR